MDTKILENDIPVFIVSFATQEMLLFRNAKTRELVVGAENKVEQCTYVAVITRVTEEVDNELTAGWKVIEVGNFALSHLRRVADTSSNRWGDEAPVLTSRLKSNIHTTIHSHFRLAYYRLFRCRCIITTHSLFIPHKR